MALSLLSAPAVADAASAKINIKIDGQAQTYDTAPYMNNDRTLVPLRGIFEKLGAEVFWQEETSTVYAVKGDLNIVLPIGSKQARVNGQTVQLDQPAEVTKGRTMVPIRFVSETLGADVQWEQRSNSVIITSGAKQLPQGGQALHLPLSYEFVLDPTLASDSSSLTLLTQIGEGLTRLDRTGAAAPGVAKSWSVSPDGKTYRFYLRDNAKWSDGTAVTAQDFAFGWQRGQNPELQGAYAFLLDGVNVQAVDSQTLDVTLAKPEPSLLEQLTLPIFFPQKRQFVESKGEAYGTDVKQTLSNGPFTVTAWAHEQYALLEKNAAYWDQGQVRLQKVNYYIGTADLAARFRQGKLDRIPLSAADYAANAQSPQLSRVSNLVTSYLQFNTEDAVLGNAKIRQALGYGLDAEALIDALGARGRYEPATGMVPSGIINGSGGTYRTDSGDLLQRQVRLAQAKTLLAAGLKELGLSKLPSVKLLIDDGDFARKTGAALQAEWRQQLGIDVQAEYVSFGQRLQRSGSGDYQLLFGSWGADYNDPDNFLDMFLSDGLYNDANYVSSAFDAALHKALQESDRAKRMAAYRQAESIMLADLPVAPLFFTFQGYLTRPEVKNWQAVPGMAVNYDLKLTYLEGK